MSFEVSIITPAVGSPALMNLISSICSQSMQINVEHILLWDDVRDPSFTMDPYKFESMLRNETGYPYSIQHIVLKGRVCNRNAPGSALRAIGLMAAQGKYITFADEDIRWRSDHLMTILQELRGKEWGYCKRCIFSPNGEYLGVDDFESVGLCAKTPYKMVDNNSMMFTQRFGVNAAVLYRDTEDYNDDRLMFQFLTEYGEMPGVTGKVTIEQICPERLIEFFKQNCTPEE